MAGQGKAAQGRVGQGSSGQIRAGQLKLGTAGQGRARHGRSGVRHDRKWETHELKPNCENKPTANEMCKNGNTETM